MVRDRDETETFDFQSETRPRPSHVSTRPRRDRDVLKLRLETETSRPRLHPCSKQLETTFHQFCEEPLHIAFKTLIQLAYSLLLFVIN